MRWLLVTTVMLATATGGVLAAQATSPATMAGAVTTASRTSQLRAIEIDGGRGLPLAELRAALTARVGELVDAGQLARDRDALEAALGARGFLAAKVSEPVITYTSDGAYVVFDVDTGAMFHLRSVTVTGLPPRDASIVTIASGDPAIGARLAQARESLELSLGRDGKAANVELQVHSDRDAAAVDVELVTR